MVRIFLFFVLITLVCGQHWQSYVDDNLIGGGLQQAAIIGYDGSKWAISRGFSLKLGEPEALISLFNNPSVAFAKGVTVNATKYLVSKADRQSIYGKKGNDGVIIVKTEQAILIGVYDKSSQPGKAASIVEKLGDYLRENGF